MDSRPLHRKFSGMNLSDYWRTDHSADRASELASVLEGARAAVSMMEGEYPVRWLSQGSTGPGIWLDPSVLNGFQPPFPGKAVDVVIGLALHEVGHEKWTRPFPRGTRVNRLSSEQYTTLLSIHNILEDAYIDTHTGRLSPVLGEYITTARQAFVSGDVARGTLEYLRQAPNRDNVVDLWAGISLYHLPFTAQDAHPDMLEAIIHLMDETMRYIELESNRARADRAWQVFRYIEALPEPPAPQQQAPAQSVAPPPDVNPWLDDGSGDESGPSGESAPAEREKAPAMTEWDDKNVEEDWDKSVDDVRDDSQGQSGDSQANEAGDQSADESDVADSQDGMDADAQGEHAPIAADDETDGTDSRPENTGDGSELEDTEDADEAGIVLGTEGDDVFDQLLRNLTSGMGGVGTDHPLSDLSDFFEQRGKGWLTAQEAEEIDAAIKGERRDMAPALARELGMPRLSRLPVRPAAGHV